LLGAREGSLLGELEGMSVTGDLLGAFVGSDVTGDRLGDLEGDEVGEFVVGTSSSVVTVMLFMFGPAVLGPAVSLILLVVPEVHGI